MRSIRRSLILWFLGLTVLTLGVVVWLVDGVVGRAIRAREQASAEIVARQHALRVQEEIDRVDQSLLDEARGIAQSMQFLYADSFRTAVTTPIRRSWESVIAFGPFNPLAALNVEMMATNRLYPAFGAEFLAKRPLDESILNRVTDDEHFRDYYQVHTFGRNVRRSRSLGEETLPDFNASKIDVALPNWLPADEVELKDGTAVRRLVYVSPVVFFRQFGPPRRGDGDRTERSSTGTGGQRGTPPAPPPTGPPSPPRPAPTPESIVRATPRIYVQTARPMSILNGRIADFERERDADLAKIRLESYEATTRTRGLLLTIAAGAIAAMLVGSLILISRGLAPVNELSSAVRMVSERDFRLPVTADRMSTELLPVHRHMTETLDALKHAFEREKQAVADISHELRTPVASLAATLDVALRKPRSAEQYKATLEECRDINRQLGRLVERVMTLANLDAGNDRSVTAPCDAAEIGRECVRVIRPLAEKQGLSVTCELPAEWPITTDGDKLREVLMNLLHNAVEYTPAGGTVTVAATPAARGGVKFVVRDTGIGMSPDVSARIFERFYRADSSRTAVGVHAGLGLAIVKEYLSRMGGSVAVESTPGRGSTFTVEIPSLSA
jgi:signal transduction histidine kinase